MKFKKEIDVYRYIFRFYPHVPDGKFDVIASYGRIWLLVVTPEPECILKKYLLTDASWIKLNDPRTFDVFNLKLDKAFIDAGYE